MPRPKDSDYKSIAGLVVFHSLDFLTKNGREIPARPTPSPAVQRRYTSSTDHAAYRPSPVKDEKTIWPGVEAPVDFPRLAPRTRSITPPPVTDDEREIGSHRECMLLQLPREVLRTIFEMVVGGDVIHIVRRNTSLGHAICICQRRPPSFEECTAQQCEGVKLRSGIYIIPSDTIPSHLLALSKTCRAIYTLTTPLLYTSPIFAFSAISTLLAFSTSILPPRLDSIRHLRLSFDFSLSSLYGESTAYNDPPAWERLWRVVGSMRSLKELEVWIKWHRENFSPVEEERLMMQLEQVGGLERFVVCLPRLKGREVRRKKGDVREYEVVRRA